MKIKKHFISIVILIIFMLNAVGCKNQTMDSQSAEQQNQSVSTSSKVETKEETKESQTSTDAEPKKEEAKVNTAPKEISGLVRVKDLDSTIALELRYATTNNFTGKKVYPIDVCVLRKETAEKLVKANEEFKKKGYRIKIWDAYRPPYVQQIFWDMVKDSRYVANPNNGGSNHNRGTAVDMTLVDKDGKELKMPTDFDNFTTKAYRNNTNISKEVKQNLDLLTQVMKKSGFIPLNTEWWHFNDSDSSKYKIVDIKLEQFLD